ncbi:hypothetical protein BJ742DRAFT_871425 [Cladochytrium replicatum]|nr:hypothetical protein BJ742DRAFT_871425 [Cladochytrium replicatum]
MAAFVAAYKTPESPTASDSDLSSGPHTPTSETGAIHTLPTVFDVLSGPKNLLFRATAPITGPLRSAINMFPTSTAEAYDTLTSPIRTAVDVISSNETLDSVTAPVRSAVSAIAQTSDAIATTAVSAITTTSETLTTPVRHAVTAIAQTSDALATTTIGAITTTSDSLTAPVRNAVSALANSETIDSLNNLARSAPVTSQLYSVAQAATGNAKGAYKTQVDFLSNVVDAALFVPMTTVNSVKNSARDAAVGQVRAVAIAVQQGLRAQPVPVIAFLVASFYWFKYMFVGGAIYFVFFMQI